MILYISKLKTKTVLVTEDNSQRAIATRLEISQSDVSKIWSYYSVNNLVIDDVETEALK